MSSAAAEVTRLEFRGRGSNCLSLLALSAAVFTLGAANIAFASAAESQLVDLPTALRLAGAQNLDVRIAQERLAEARANEDAARLRFFPWIAPGISYRRHDDKIQDVAGNIVDVHKYSYAPGVTLAAEVNLGDAIYQRLAAKQIAQAATHAAETERQRAVFAAAQSYFDLAFAQAAVGVATESVRLARNYETQLSAAVEAGLTFKGDLLRVRVQAERNELSLQQTRETQRTNGARLAVALRLDPALELMTQEGDLAPLALIEDGVDLGTLVPTALDARPELRESVALANAAEEIKNGASRGPWIPSLRGEAFLGELGGGRRGGDSTSGSQQDYFVGVTWRIGPGGLFDSTRTRAAEAKHRAAELGAERTRDAITREVVEAFVQWQSFARQLDDARAMLTAAEEAFRLARERKEFAVGIVLETIQAEQDLTRARLDYLRIVAAANVTQYRMQRAIGKL